MKEKKGNRLKQIFDLYTSDLSYDEIERLVKRDASEVYEFFKKEIPKPDQRMNKGARAIVFARSLISAFLLKMNPARRFFYFAALLFLIVGMNPEMSGYLVLSFLIMTLLLAFELADKLLMRDELEIARKIQSELVPKSSPVIEGYSISFHYEPAREVGGDYLDFIYRSDDEKTFLIVGDVSGKGIAAALYVVRVQAILHQVLLNLQSLRDSIISLKKYFSHNLRREFFLTLAAAEINKEGSVSICRAGHNPVYYLKNGADAPEELKPQGLALGFNDTVVFDKVLEEITIKPEPGDILFFYTDGVTETMSRNKILFGEEKIKEILAANRDKEPDAIKEIIISRLESFRGDASITDDLAFIILKRNRGN